MNNQFCQCPNAQTQYSDVKTQCTMGQDMNTQMNFNSMDSFGGCPRPQPLVAPKKVCISNQVTPVPQPVICPIECRRVNRCMYYPVYYPQYEQTYVTLPCNQF